MTIKNILEQHREGRLSLPQAIHLIYGLPDMEPLMKLDFIDMLAVLSTIPVAEIVVIP